MSATKRVQQWLTFTRTWWLYDATWQDPYMSGRLITRYLRGDHKPIFSGAYADLQSDCGDHVVVINSSKIALKADDWYYRVYFHHTGYPGGATWTKAWELHKKDPTMIMWKAVYNNLGRSLERRPRIHRLHVFKDDNIPAIIKGNITDQIRPIRKVPKKMEDYTKKEIQEFPKLWDFPEGYVQE